MTSLERETYTFSDDEVTVTVMPVEDEYISEGLLIEAGIRALSRAYYYRYNKKYKPKK